MEGPLDPQTEPNAPASSSPAPAAEPAQRPASTETTPAPARSPRETTATEPAGQPETPAAQLTPEQRAAVLREADPDEFARANDRFSGYVGKRLQVERAEAEKKARDQQLLGLRDRAARQGDADAALEYARHQATAEEEGAHQAAWSDAVGIFTKLDANPRTKPIVGALAGRDYGAMAAGNGTIAALLYKADLVTNVIEHLPKWEEEIRAEIEAATEKKLRPVLEREIKARLSGHDPEPDTGTGAAPGASDLPRTLDDTRRWVKEMSPAEYARREDEIDRHVATLTRRRATTR